MTWQTQHKGMNGQIRFTDDAISSTAKDCCHMTNIAV